MSSLMGASTGSAVVGSVPELVEGQMDGEASTGSAVAVPADVVLPKRSSSMGAARQLVGLLAAPAARDRASWALPVGALAVVSALSMSVAAGVRFFFFTVEGEMGSLYKSLAVMALVLLLVPLMTLAGAAARLSTSRRDTRLSSLRLLGASSATLRLMTLAENAAVALTGAVLGVFGHVALMPLFGQLHFAGRRIGVGDMWLGLGPVLAAVAAIIVVVVTSAAIGLRRIEISPLGVRTRDKAPRMSWLRAAGGGAAVLLAYFLAQSLGQAKDFLAIAVMMLVMFALPLLAINQMGPWLVSRVARRDLKHARTPVQLLAARAVLDDPKQSWRQVGALGFASFVAVFAGVGLALSSGGPTRPEDAMVMGDIRTGVLLTLAICFVTVAFSVGINQSAAVLDKRSLCVGLDMIGMEPRAIDAARRRAVMRPLVLVVLLGALSALALVLPLGAANQVASPTAALTVGASLIAGVGLVWLALRSTRIVLDQVLRVGLVRAE